MTAGGGIHTQVGQYLDRETGDKRTAGLRPDGTSSEPPWRLHPRDLSGSCLWHARGAKESNSPAAQISHLGARMSQLGASAVAGGMTVMQAFRGRRSPNGDVSFCHARTGCLQPVRGLGTSFRALHRLQAQCARRSPQSPSERLRDPSLCHLPP